MGGPPLLWGETPHPWPPPPGNPLPGCAPLGGLYKGGRGRAAAPLLHWRLPLPVTPLPLSTEAWRSPAGTLLHPPPRRRAAGSSSTSPSPLLDQEGGDVDHPVRVMNAEVP